MDGCRGSPEAVPKLVCLGACDAGTERGFALADGAHSPAEGWALGGDLGPLDWWPDDHLHGRIQQLVLGREAQNPQVLNSIQLPTFPSPSNIPRWISFRCEKPRQMTRFPGGGSLARAK